MAGCQGGESQGTALKAVVLSRGFEQYDQNLKFEFGQKIPSMANTNVECERYY